MILPRSTPSTKTLIFPSWSLRLWTILATVPTLKISSGRGSSIEASCWVARKIFLSPANASSSARTLDSRPTTKGVIIYGKMTTSRMGIMGRRFVSDFSLEVSMGTENQNPEFRSQNPEASTGNPGLFLARLFEQGHVDLLRHDHFLCHQELADLLVRRQIVHQIQHQVFENHTQAPGAYFALHGERRNCFQGIVAKFQSNIFKFE